MQVKCCGAIGLLVLTMPGFTRADETSAVAALEKRGATILYVENKPGNPVDSVYLPGPEVTDGDLKHLASFGKLKVLKLDSATGITDAGLKELAGLKGLQDLGLGHTKVTDAGLKHLLALRELRALNLNFTAVSDEGLKHIKSFKKLELLGLYATKVTPEGLKDLQTTFPKCKIVQ
jgi:hypothetical protein